MGGMLYLIAQIYLCGSCVYVGDKTSYIYISIVWVCVCVCVWVGDKTSYIYISIVCVCVCVEALRGQPD